MKRTTTTQRQARLRRAPNRIPWQIVCVVCGGLANRHPNARYCGDKCKAIAREMRAA